MSALLDALSAICREHPLREKVVVVPSLAIGHQIGDAVARAGTSWINLRFETVRTIADAVAGFDLARRGMTVLSRAQALALIERACDRVLDASSYFAPLADRPGLHRAVQRSIDDLRHARIARGAMNSSSFEDARKARDLVRILDAYEEEMKRGGYFDRLGVLERAIEILEGGASDDSPSSALRASSPRKRGEGRQGDDLRKEGKASREDLRREEPESFEHHLWFLLDDVELTPREQRLVELASGGGLRTLTALTTIGPVEFRRAIGEENEIRGALRAVLQSRENIDHAEVIYTAREPYLPLAFELSAEYGLPCTFAEGIPSYFTRPGSACLAFLRWIGEGWHAIELQRIAGGRIARVLRNAAIGWGRDRYLTRIDALIAEAGERKNEHPRAAEASQRIIEHAREARLFVERMLAISEEVVDATDVASASRAAAAFVETVRPRNEIDLMAREGLARMFSELSAIGAAPASRSDVTSRLAGAVHNLHVAASNPRPGHLHVAPLRAGAWSSRSRLFVMGLDEERHPGSGIQDPILLDSERVAIGMPIAGDRPEKMTEQFRRLLGRAASRNITLSWSSLRLRDRRELSPSSALLEIDRKAVAVAAEERFVDPTPLSASDWWLYRRFAEHDTALSEALLAAYPALAAGARAEEERDSPAITAYDGKIDAPAGDLDPRLTSKPYSASQLEKMASCPYQWFLDRVLRIAPLDDLKFEADTWLEAYEYGRLLHQVFQTAMEELCAAGLKPSLTFLPRTEEIARAALQEWRARVPPPNESAFQRRERELLRSCEIFLKTEEAACLEVTPKHFEMAFDEFALPLGEGRAITLRGFIDRIDYDDARNEWHVWDYKSGLSKDYEGVWSLLRGTKMQPALYARAASAKLGGPVTKSGYIFPTPRGRGARILNSSSDADLQRAINLLSDVVASGWFPHAEECRWCDFEEICGGRELAAKRTAAKLDANPSDPAVRAWLELQGIE